MSSPVETAPLPPLDSPELEARVRAAVEDVRPMLQSDGGDIAFLGLAVGAEGPVVRVELVGACRTCPSQGNTLRFGVENHIRELVPEVAGLQLEEGVLGGRRRQGWAIY